MPVFYIDFPEKYDFIKDISINVLLVKEREMPGIITHSKVFLEALKYARKKKPSSLSLRSIDILFGNDLFLKAGLFGCLGPDIFNYIPLTGHRDFYGSPISYILHSSRLEKSLLFLFQKALLIKDPNNEWNAMRRAYLHGYVSHVITDAVFHPFMFYWTGFPEIRDKRQNNYYREQYLLFTYNMDLYFQHYHDQGGFDISPESLIPMKKTAFGTNGLEAPVKSFLLELLQGVYPEFIRFRVLRWRIEKRGAAAPDLCILDALPGLITRSYRFKLSASPFMRKLLGRLGRRHLLYPDCITLIPEAKRVNRHVLNLHRERWYYPAGKPSLHYESAEDLFKIAKEKTIGIWDKIESIVYSEKKEIAPVISELIPDAFTGEARKDPAAMKIKHPVRLRF